MNINRHNYEAFFLLYVDNELQPADRKAVDDFVAQNHDLHRELHMLQQAVLDCAEPAEFPHKQNLLKYEHGICLSNYEQYFLLDVDNELSQSEKDELEQFVLKHPALQQEYTMLLSAKLKTDIVNYPFKHKLYKHAITYPMLPRFLVRGLAVAAVVSGVLASVWLFKNGNNVASPGKGISLTTPLPKAKNQVVVPSKAAPASNALATSTVANKIVTAPANNGAAARHHFVQPGSKQVPKQTETLAQVALANTTEKVSINPPVEVVAAQPTIIAQQPQIVAFSGNEIRETVAVTTTIYTEMNDGETDNIQVGFTRLNKSKLKGLLKRASALIDKKINLKDDNSSTQIASFQIKG